MWSQPDTLVVVYRIYFDTVKILMSKTTLVREEMCVREILNEVNVTTYRDTSPDTPLLVFGDLSSVVPWFQMVVGTHI